MSTLSLSLSTPPSPLCSILLLTPSAGPLSRARRLGWQRGKCRTPSRLIVETHPLDDGLHERAGSFLALYLVSVSHALCADSWGSWPPSHGLDNDDDDDDSVGSLPPPRGVDNETRVGRAKQGRRGRGDRMGGGNPGFKRENKHLLLPRSRGQPGDYSRDGARSATSRRLSSGPLYPSSVVKPSPPGLITPRCRDR